LRVPLAPELADEADDEVLGDEASQATATIG
jgi:hypothetical protein